jgi:hypothetical protein
MRRSPSQERKLETYREQARASREVAAFFSTRRHPSSQKFKERENAGYPPPREPETPPAQIVSASPDAPPVDAEAAYRAQLEADQAAAFDESPAARLERRYGGEVPGTTWWHA